MTDKPSAGAADLLPCPFCNSRNVGLRTGAAGNWVACISCGLEAPSETGVTADQAVKYWNTRPPVAGAEVGVRAEFPDPQTIEACAAVVEDFPETIVHMWERPGGPPGNGYRATTRKDLAAAIRSVMAVSSSTPPPVAERGGGGAQGQSRAIAHYGALLSALEDIIAIYEWCSVDPIDRGYSALDSEIHRAKHLLISPSVTSRAPTPETGIEQILRDHFWTGEPGQIEAIKSAAKVLRQQAERGCICQDQHRRGYCTEPGCPYALTSAEPVAERGGGGAPDPVELAAWLCALEDAECHKPIPESLITHGRRYILAGMTEKHCGDCTNQSHSCVVCGTDGYLLHARQIIEALSHSSTTPSPTPETGDGSETSTVPIENTGE